MRNMGFDGFVRFLLIIKFDAKQKKQKIGFLTENGKIF